MLLFLHYLYRLGISTFFIIYLITFPFHYLIHRKKALARIGHIPIHFKTSRPVWIHAVSGGEVKLSEILIKKYFNEKNVFLTFMSSSAENMAEKLYQENPRVKFSYLPFDFYGVMNRLIKKINPLHFIIIEHDLWINLLTLLEKKKISSTVVNYVIKKKDYERYNLFPLLLSLTHKVSHIFCQNESDVEWLKKHLNEKTLIECLGNLKYEISHNSPLPPYILNTIKKQKNKIWITLGSSHSGEEKIVIEALKKYLVEKKITLLIVPRHPERSSQIVKLISTFNFDSIGDVISYQKLLTHPTGYSPSIIIGDQMGILESIYALSDINIIGDSFFPGQGGHNFLESLQFEKATLYGKYFNSFSDITPLFEKQRGVLRVDASNLGIVLENLIEYPEERKKLGGNGLKLLKKLAYDWKKLDFYFK